MQSNSKYLILCTQRNHCISRIIIHPIGVNLFNEMNSGKIKCCIHYVVPILTKSDEMEISAAIFYYSVGAVLA